MDSHEEWRNIDYTNNKYAVSSLGNIRNNETGNVLKPSHKNKGYEKIEFKVNGKRIHKSVHRVVAMAFIPNPENKSQVNHKNGIKNDNRVENLEWVTADENYQHARANHLQEKGLAKMHDPDELTGNERFKKSMFRKCDSISEKDFNALRDMAENKGVTIYGLYKTLLNEIDSLKKQIDCTTQNDFLVKCLRQEIKQLTDKCTKLKKALEDKPKPTTYVGTDDPRFNLGEKRNYLTIIGYAKETDNRTRLICRCDCGTIRMVHQWHWLNDKVKSCGCKHDELCRRAAV